MPKTDIAPLLTAPKENEHLEFKTAAKNFHSADLFRYCVALANEGGGLLVLGISDRIPRQVIGSEAFPDVIKTEKQIFDKLRFRVDVEEIIHEGKRIVVFHIPARPQGSAYDFEGAFLMRVGESLTPMTEERLRQIFSEGRPDFLLKYAKKNLSQEDVIHMLDIQGYYDLMKMRMPNTWENVLDRLAQEKLVKKLKGSWAITNLGALLFAKNLEDFDGLKRKTPRVIVYKGTNKISTLRERIFTQGYAVGFKNLVDYVNDQLPSNEVIGSALREDVRMYPELAIRELVANALIHQDLNDTSTFVMIEIYADRIEISNPGLPLVPVERFIDGYKSRNERMTDVMRRLGICEEKSSGIDKVISLIESYQLPAPDFRKGTSNTTAIIYAAKEFNDMDKQEKIRACYQHACLMTVSDQKMTNQSLKKRFKLPSERADAVSRIIRDTLKLNLIKTDDPENKSKRYAKYVPHWA